MVNLREIRMPWRPKYIQGLGEHIIVDKPWIHWEQAHQQNDVATTEDDAKYLQSVSKNNIKFLYSSPRSAFNVCSLQNKNNNRD